MSRTSAKGGSSGSIEPYGANPFYWQYKGEPVLLIGASGDDNPFQWAGAQFDQHFLDLMDKAPGDRLSASDPENGRKLLASHLDLLASLGGNWIRNAVFGRFRYEQNDPLCDRYPVDYQQVYEYRMVDGKYDLTRSNTAYYDRLRTFLDMTKERGIFVGLDLTDYEPWEFSPFTADLNINYAWAEVPELARMKKEMPWGSSPFWCVGPRENAVLTSFVLKRYETLLDLTLQYDHILYNLKNESCCPVEISDWWCDWLHAYAAKQGKRIQLTENRLLRPMRTYEAEYEALGYTRDGATNLQDMRLTEVSHSIVNHDRYDFVDIANTSLDSGQRFYDDVAWFRERVDEHKRRPVNFVKMYSTDLTGREKGGHDEAIARCYRAFFAGAAAVRLHRNGQNYGCSAGVGLSPLGQTHVKSLRMFADAVDIFNMTPRNDLLGARGEDEAYCLAEPGRQYAVYFPGLSGAGAVDLDLASAADKALNLKWLNTAEGKWQDAGPLPGGHPVRLAPPSPGLHWLAVLTAH